MDGMGGGWWMGAGSLIFIALIALVMLAMRRADEPREPAKTGSAEEILAARFAHGDIDEAEYRARLEALRR